MNALTAMPPIRLSSLHASFVRRAGFVLAASGALAGLLGAAPALAHDYPTADRVIYVQECMRQHPGPHYEMLNKCACALDKMAEQVPFADFEEMQTATNASTIGGERGGVIRDSPALQEDIKRFRGIQSTAKKACFINLDPK